MIIPGDFDADEDVDLDDFGVMADSIAGPGLPPQSSTPECVAAHLVTFDFDNDGDVDLDDFGQFQLQFMGPV